MAWRATAALAATVVATALQEFRPLSTGLSNVGNSVFVGGNSLVYIGGQFDIAGGVVVHGVAAWDPSFQTWNALLPGPGVVPSSVNALNNYFSNLIVGGQFNSTAGGAVIERNIGQYLIVAGQWINIGDVGVGDAEYVLAVKHTIPFLDLLFAGGLFTAATGLPSAKNIAAYNGTGWNAVGPGLSDIVRVIQTVSFNQVVVGGDFLSTADASVELNHIGRWNGVVWTAFADQFGIGVDGPVYAMVEANPPGGPFLFVAGSFNNAGSLSNATHNIARWHEASSSWSSLGSGVNGPIYTMALLGGAMYIGGDFFIVGGISPHNLAKFDVGSLVFTAVDGVNGEGTNGPVKSLGFLGSDLYFTGSFSVVGVNTAASNAAMLGPASATPTPTGTPTPTMSIGASPSVSELVCAWE